jgi:nucleotide-binding universal stress UspA family protein
MELFKTILIPVDFTMNTEVAICKALEIADARDVVIHLLHICKPSFNDISLGKSSRTEKEIDAELKLNEWKQNIEDYNPLAKVICRIEPFLSIEQGIVDKCSELYPDLIVVGKTSSHSLLPMLNTIAPSRIAIKRGRPVLTVKPGSLHRHFKHVIVPISENVAESKINVVTTLCKRNRIRISLVTFINDKNIPEQFSASSLLQVYKKLKSISVCQVEFAVLHGRNRVRSILQFAEENEADILLLEPDSETKIGWPDKHISDVINRDSRVQVLTV